MGKVVDESLCGRFCQSDANRFGIGRLERITGDVSTIRYTDLPVPHHQHTYEVPTTSVKVVELPVETRAFVPMNGYWTAGRVQGPYRDQYRILLPDGILANLDESEFEVRWSRPLQDPAAALAYRVVGSPIYHRARLPFKKSLQRQRSLVHGYTAISSSPIAIYQHQINVAARVLVDPVMRYLLADEVGLGKTMQAGLVVRQVLLDDRDALIVVAVPDTLVDQWKGELSEKFLVGVLRPLKKNRVAVVPFERAPEAVARYSPSLLVVDEAHRLVEEATIDDLSTLASMSAGAPGLLLLTATPFRGRPETFLRMLHLIDPLSYPLEDVTGFATRIDERQQDAYSMLSLDSNLPTEILSSLLDDLEGRHKHDVGVGQRVADVRSAFGQPNLGSAIDELTVYMREVHRISRRVIRTRRRSIVAQQFPVRGRTGSVVSIDRPCTSEIQLYLERIRAIADGLEGAFESEFAVLVEYSNGGLVPLGEHLTELLGSGSSAAMKELRPVLSALKAELSLSPDNGVDPIVNATVTALSSANSKGIVATSFTEQAKVLAEGLRRRLGTRSVAEHRADLPVESRNKAVMDFDRSADCRVLVMDRSGEEGRNLQSAGFMLHADMPFSPNRLEQRIGRVDRYGSGAPVENLLVVDPASDYEVALAELMTEGIGIVDDSVSTLQRPLADLEQTVRNGLVPWGPEALRVDFEQLHERLESERQRIDELEEIESSDTMVEFSTDAFEELQQFEDSWGDIELIFDRFTAAGDGGVQLHKRTDPEVPHVFEYTVDPKLKKIPLMRMDHINAVAELLPGRRSFSRMLSLRNQRVRPVRVGDPLVDWLEDYLETDDRGRAWAVWRHVDGLQVGHFITCFRFDYSVSFDSAPIGEIASDASTIRRLRRRGDAFLPPRTVTVWMHDGKEVPQAFVLKYLDKGEDDHPLTWKSDEVISWKNWDHIAGHFPEWDLVVREARVNALELVRHDLGFRREIELATAAAEHEVRRRISILEMSVARLDEGPRRKNEAEELETEKLLGEAILTGLRQPRVDLYSCGTVILASQPIGSNG